MSLNEILERFVRGGEVNMRQDAYYMEDEELPIEDLEKMDYFEKRDLLNEVRQEIQERRRILSSLNGTERRDGNEERVPKAAEGAKPSAGRNDQQNPIPQTSLGEPSAPPPN